MDDIRGTDEMSPEKQADARKQETALPSMAHPSSR